MEARSGPFALLVGMGKNVYAYSSLPCPDIPKKKIIKFYPGGIGPLNYFITSILLLPISAGDAGVPSAPSCTYGGTAWMSGLFGGTSFLFTIWSLPLLLHVRLRQDYCP